MIFHVVLLIMTSCMRRARREWLDAICRLIIWSTLSSQTSIPRDPLTATVQLLQRGSSMSHLTSYYYCRHTRSWPNATDSYCTLRELWSLSSNVPGTATVPARARVAFQDHGREPRNVSNGSTMGRFFLGSIPAVLPSYFPLWQSLPFSTVGIVKRFNIKG